ncbi:hypothetical protein [Emticicia sp. C21]|uniref:hypothetical protein n=1 Tax=Emticicia sp. C21 TaxID=2302915 RepID=UPI000E347FAD|nr:hypothetical protein [Emticicia sp. C21]RFS16995.1 hypothetical protein D0T08_09975 [Emticicia sp. C21]
MATSKPVFQGIVLKDSGTNYCGLFNRRVINTSSVAATQYYWLPTNSSGEITDYRANIMSGTTTHATDTLALANKPAGYGTFVDSWPTTKYLSYMNMYPFQDLGQFKSGVDSFVASGATNIVIPVLWSDIFDSNAEQITNSSTAYNKQNLAIDFVQTKYPYVKISLLLLIYQDAERRNANKWWPVSVNEKDCWNNDLGVWGYGNAHAPLSDKTAGAGRSMMLDFFTKVTNYYANKLGSQFNYIIPTITEQAEYGFNYENGNPAYKAIIGYSGVTKSAFRTWLFNAAANPGAYANREALNTAWGTGYTADSQIEPPNTGLGQGTTDVAELNTVFASKRGVDWYLFRESMLYDFASDCKNAVTAANSTYNTNIKFILSFGGVSPNDELVPLRATYNIIKWGQISDGMKTAFASDNRFNDTSLTLDYVQNYPKKIMTELHHIDYFGDQNNPLPYDVVKANMIQSGYDAIANGAKDLLFIGGPYQDLWFSSVLKPVFSTVSPEFLRDNSNNRAALVNGSAAINLGELLYSGHKTGGIQKWSFGGGRADNRINITFTNSTAPLGDANYPLGFQVKDNQRYYIRQADIKNSYYGFRSLEDENNNKPYTTLQQNYNSTRFPIILTAFGITYPTGVAKTKSTIEITHSSGVKWLKVEQQFGVNPNEGSSDYSNNHPEYRFLNNPNLVEDCRFWLPLPSSHSDYYNIIITVADAPCRFDVYHADGNAPGGIIYNQGKSNTPAGTSETIRIYGSQLTQSNIHQRLIKINNNLWP